MITISKKVVRWIAWIIVAVAIAVPVFFYYQYEKKVYNTLMIENANVQFTLKFLNNKFPGELSAYLEILKSQKNSPAPAPLSLPEAPKK